MIIIFSDFYDKHINNLINHLKEQNISYDLYLFQSKFNNFSKNFNSLIKFEKDDIFIIHTTNIELIKNYSNLKNFIDNKTKDIFTNIRLFDYILPVYLNHYLYFFEKYFDKLLFPINLNNIKINTIICSKSVREDIYNLAFILKEKFYSNFDDSLIFIYDDVNDISFIKNKNNFYI